MIKYENIVIKGFDWGPCSSKIIIHIEKNINEEALKEHKFTVQESKKAFIDTEGEVHYEDKAREVIAVYPCDTLGNKLNESEYIAIEMYCSPEDGRVFCYNHGYANNHWCDPYEMTITVTGENIEDTMTHKINLDAGIKLGSEKVDFSGEYKCDNGRMMKYISFEPDNHSQKRPLVIWLHGAGEGGDNPFMLAYGNKVTALFGKEFQEAMGGTYILAPQCPTYWMEYDDPETWANNPGVPSIYKESLMGLIKQFVQAHTDIDEDRIIVGGCSNGGYMTMDLAMTYPDYFAAAYPICEAYLAAGITDSMLEAVKKLPLWFIYCKNDIVVDPKQYEEPVIEKLKQMNANIHVSVFDKVVDTTGLYKLENGEPFEFFSGHESWTYFFNNKCSDGELNMWDWMKNSRK